MNMLADAGYDRARALAELGSSACTSLCPEGWSRSAFCGAQLHNTWRKWGRVSQLRGDCQSRWVFAVNT